ncbi:serine/threonine-protein kinase [Xylaria cf. heliscus]|nr:serine/threonine-protein kinase [Xylaria cf. heliscus]
MSTTVTTGEENKTAKISACSGDSRSRPQLHIGLFDLVKPLGKGSFGQVYLARHRESDWICALKVLYKEGIMRNSEEVYVRNEIDIHRQLCHPGIVDFYGWFHDSSRIVLILEYAIGGELFKSLERGGPFSEQCSAKYISQIALALLYLHEKHIMHRDIKPENILLGNHGELKLADFGYAVQDPDDRQEDKCGTLEYKAPEMLLPGPLSYTKAVDLWALGVLTYELLTAATPFADTSNAVICRKICKLDMEPLPRRISSEAKDFIQSLLVLDPSKRLPLKNVSEHPWIMKNCR